MATFSNAISINSSGTGSVTVPTGMYAEFTARVDGGASGGSIDFGVYKRSVGSGQTEHFTGILAPGTHTISFGGTGSGEAHWVIKQNGS